MIRRWLRSLLVFFLLLSPVCYGEEMRLLNLQHRTAEEILPLLKPMNSRMKLTGNGYQLIVRGSAMEIAELESLVAQLDQALRQFLIRVRFAGDQAGSEASQDGSVRIHTGEDTQVAIGATVKRHSTQRQDQDAFTARATEGMPTWISTGTEKPGYLVQAYDHRGGGIIAQSDPVQTSSGFYAKVRANGNLVTIEIAPQKSSFNEEHSSRIDVQQMQTQVTGRLGEWIELGGVDQSAEYEGSGTLYSTQRNSHDATSIFLQVEEVNP